MIRPPPKSPLFPYTTLFRSSKESRGADQADRTQQWQLRPLSPRARHDRSDDRQGRLDHARTERRSRQIGLDRKSTRLNSSHSQISYAVFCLKKKKKSNSHNVQSQSNLNPCLSSPYLHMLYNYVHEDCLHRSRSSRSVLIILMLSLRTSHATA